MIRHHSLLPRNFTIMTTTKTSPEKKEKKNTKVIEEKNTEKSDDNSTLTPEEILKMKKKEAKIQKTEEKEEKKEAKVKKTVSKKIGGKRQIQKRNPLKMHGKKYRTVEKLIEKGKLYESLAEAAELLKKTSTVKFDASTEIHINLNIDTKQSDQMVRSTVALPHGIGKKVRIVAFVDDDKIKEALKAGAVEAGNTDLFTKVQKGWLDFDIAIATPDQMRELGKIAKILGPKGLMPNPKAGTVTSEVGKTIEELQAGKVEFRNDKQGNLHNIFGKISFDAKKLEENLRVYLVAIAEAKPSGIKGQYVRSITLSTTMGPGIHLNVNTVLSGLK